MKDKFYIQETIGGWKQNAIYEGTYNQCATYFMEHNLNYGNAIFDIVHESEYVVDYI